MSRGGKRENAGRPKGMPNKVTSELRGKVNQLLENQWEVFLSDIKELSPKERVDTLVKLLEYALPKLNRTEISEKDDTIQSTKMTPEERKARIKELIIKSGIELN